MTETEAVTLVTTKCRELRIPAAMRPASAERAIVEYAQDRTRAGCVENRIAWIVTLTSSTGFVSVHVDDRTGQVLTVRRSA
jgi:hypothetical protein